MGGILKSLARRFSRMAHRHLLTEINLRRIRSSGLYRELIVREENQMGRLRIEHEGLIRGGDPQGDLRRRERRFFSQGGEDGLMLHFFSLLGAPGKTFMEIGIEDGTECNSANLAINFGWHGVFYEASPSLAEKARQFYHTRHGLDPKFVRVECAFVTPDNVNDLFRQHAPGGDLDLLSIDIDGCDYWVWEAVQAVRPRLVVMEYNACFGDEDAVTVPYEPTFDRYQKHLSGWYHGASLVALTKLARAKGYLLAGCDSFGANAFFVRSDIAVGQLREFTPAEAFYPSRPRLREMSQAGQIALMRQFPLTSV